MLPLSDHALVVADLTMVLREPWRQLFSDHELRTADGRLRELGHQV